MELLNISPLHTAPRRGGKVYQLSLRLTGWETGIQSITGLTIPYRESSGKRGIYRIPALKIRIASLLPRHKTKQERLALDIKTAKNPLSLPPNWTILWWALGITAAGTALWFLVKKLIKWQSKRATLQDVQEETYCEPADVIALRRLTSLEQSDALANGSFKRYYQELSECTREYLENRFQIRALEMTTEEFFHYVPSTGKLQSGTLQLLREFLQNADLVKFARFIPDRKKAQDDLDLIRDLVMTTRAITAIPTEHSATDNEEQSE
jgi:hypothetical protein